MKGTILYGPRDIRFEERDEPKIIEPTDATLRLAATSVCGSDLWPYRGIDAPTQPTPMGHEYCGIVEEVAAPFDRSNPASSSSVHFSPRTKVRLEAGLRGRSQVESARQPARTPQKGRRRLAQAPRGRDNRSLLSAPSGSED
jgi:NADPH:quinone reductase-like Zn-dependent oxidoreductase